MIRFIFNDEGMTCLESDSPELMAGVIQIIAANQRKASKPRKPAKLSRKGVKASWARARRVAKRLGRKDFAAVRSELKAGTIKGE
jgi:hypothetical protein